MLKLGLFENNEVINLLLQAPDSQLDESMKVYIREWTSPPTPLEVLEVLDHCIYGALASDMLVGILQEGYKQLCDDAGTTHDEIVKGATWRH